MERLFNLEDIADALGVKARTVKYWKARVPMPEAVYRKGRLSIYQQSAVILWLKQVAEGKYEARFRAACQAADAGAEPRPPAPGLRQR